MYIYYKLVHNLLILNEEKSMTNNSNNTEKPNDIDTLSHTYKISSVNYKYKLLNESEFLFFNTKPCLLIIQNADK